MDSCPGGQPRSRSTTSPRWREPCRSCLFWSTDPVSRARLAAGEETEAREAWLSWVLREWGSAGRVALIDGEVVGHAIYAPVAVLPGRCRDPDLRRRHPTPSCSRRCTSTRRPATAASAGSWCRGWRATWSSARSRAVEAFGDTRGRSVGCVMPAEFLGRVGFKTQRAHVDHAADADGPAVRRHVEVGGRGWRWNGCGASSDPRPRRRRRRRTAASPEMRGADPAP